MTGRQIGDERRRYGRKSRREQLDDLRDLASRYRFWIVAVVVLIGIGGWLALVSRNVPVDRLAVGDCLYIPTAASGDPTSSTPIGAERDVEAVLEAGSAQPTDCHASHGHEVSAIYPLQPALPSVGAVTQDDLRAFLEPQCDAAFDGYVGHGITGSAYTTFAVVPTADAWAGGNRTGICLVARADGQWMSSPAHGSGG